MADPNETSGEILARPGFDLAMIDDEDRVHFETLLRAAKEGPDYIERAFDGYASSPEAAGNLIRLIREHPEGLSVLEAWDQIINRELDLNLAFDADTEEAIANDAYMASVRRDFEKDHSEVHRFAMRRRRFKVFFKRLGEIEAA
jgi:hypothetical protein